MLENLNSGPQTEATVQRVKQVEKDIKQVLSDHESFLRLRSRALWLKGRDKNTKFFHAKATRRRKNNIITSLFDKNTSWMESKTDMEQIIVRYFSNFFTFSNSPTATIN